MTGVAPRSPEAVAWASGIELTGKVTQRERMIEVGTELRRRGKTVLER